MPRYSMQAAAPASNRASKIDRTGSAQRASASSIDKGATSKASSAQREAASATRTDKGVTPTTSNTQRAATAASRVDLGLTATKGEAQSVPASDVWSQDNALLPWYDQLDWADRLGRMRHERQLSATDDAMLRKWCEEGYVVVPGLVAADLIDALVAEVDDMWGAASFA